MRTTGSPPGSDPKRSRTAGPASRHLPWTDAYQRSPDPRRAERRRPRRRPVHVVASAPGAHALAVPAAPVPVRQLHRLPATLRREGTPAARGLLVAVAAVGGGLHSVAAGLRRGRRGRRRAGGARRGRRARARPPAALRRARGDRPALHVRRGHRRSRLGRRLHGRPEHRRRARAGHRGRPARRPAARPAHAPVARRARARPAPRAPRDRRRAPRRPASTRSTSATAIACRATSPSASASCCACGAPPDAAAPDPEVCSWR